MEPLKNSRVTIIAISAIGLFFLANYLFIFLIGYTGALVSLLIAAAIGAYISWSVARTLERVLVASERSRLLWFYGGFLGALFLAWGVFVSLSEGFEPTMLAVLLVHYLPYPALAHFFLSERMVTKFLKKPAK